MIAFHNVKKAYSIPGGQRVVLRKTSFVIPDGNSLGIIGASGSGKSTLIKLMSGVELVDWGYITRSGRLSLPLGFGGALQRLLTGRQNARYVAQLYGCDADEVAAFVEEFAELGNYFDVPLDEYIGTTRQRLAYGITMAIHFDTYLVDGLPAVGDGTFREKCLEVFATRSTRSNIMMASDNRELLSQYCDSGAVLWNGQIEFFPTIDEAWSVHEELSKDAGDRWRTQQMTDEMQRRPGPLESSKAIAVEAAAARAARVRAKPAKLPPEKKVVHFRSGVQAPALPRSRLSASSRFVGRLAALCVAIPTLVVGLYLGLWASPQYTSEIKFAVRGADSGAGAVAGDALGGILTSITGTTSNLGADSYILVDYLNSREMVEKLDAAVGIRSLYSRSNADYFARLDNSLPVEQVVDYWRGRIHAVYDTATSIITVQVRAFSAEDAQRIGAAVQREAEGLVNRLSDRAQEDALRAAKDELVRSENRIQTVRGLMRRFRDKEQLADPIATASSKQAALATLEGQLVQINTALSSRRAFMTEQSPAIITLRARAEAIEKEIVKARAELGGDSMITVAGTLADFEILDLQRQFAEKAHVASLAMLESARAGAERLRRYLAVFVEPRVAQRATHPKVLQDMLLTFLACSIIFGALLLFYRSIREHMH